jgi:hypothetical protein
MVDISRRDIIKATAAGATLVPLSAASSAAFAEHPNEHRTTRFEQSAIGVQTAYLFFNSDEAAFIDAAGGCAAD